MHAASTRPEPCPLSARAAKVRLATGITPETQDRGRETGMPAARYNSGAYAPAFDFRLTYPPQKSQLRCNMFSYDCLSGCSRNIGLDYGFHETFVTGGINNENYS